MPVVPVFLGTFDGNDYVISSLHIQGIEYLGLFGKVGSGATIIDLALEAVDVNGIGSCVGGLAGYNSAGIISDSYSNGFVKGSGYTGGIVGSNTGNIVGCHSSGTVTSINRTVGGLVGFNSPTGFITTSHSTATVEGRNETGGLVGRNVGRISVCQSNAAVSGQIEVGGIAGSNYSGTITMSHSSGTIYGVDHVGGLVGENKYNGEVTLSYSSGEVSGYWNVAGLVGHNGGSIVACYSVCTIRGNSTGGLVAWGKKSLTQVCFWDTEISGQTSSDGGTGKTTGEMQTATTFLEAGWDFIDEITNGTEDIWWIDEGNDYPRLWWELIPEN